MSIPHSSSSLSSAYLDLIGKQAISELEKGRGLAEQLLGQLQFRHPSHAASGTAKPNAAVELVQEVMRCFTSAIAVLMEPFGGWSAFQKPSEDRKEGVRVALNDKRKRSHGEDRRRKIRGGEISEELDILHKQVISELDNGRIYAEQLLGQMEHRCHSSAASVTAKSNVAVELVQEVMPCFTSAIAVLMEPYGCWSAFQKPSGNQENTVQTALVNNKRKKLQGKERHQKCRGGETRVIIKSDGYAIHDNYSWRKYGQKYINGYSFPREYFKCSYEGCLATKRVQKIQDGTPGLCLVTCQNEHSCILGNANSEKSITRNKCCQREVKKERDVIVDHSTSNPFESQQLAHVSLAMCGMQTPWADDADNFGHGFQPSARGQLDLMLINDYNPQLEEEMSAFLTSSELENSGSLWF